MGPDPSGLALSAQKDMSASSGDLAVAPAAIDAQFVRTLGCGEDAHDPQWVVDIWLKPIIMPAGKFSTGRIIGMRGCVSSLSSNRRQRL